MKKLILIFALLLGGVVAFAQVTDTIDPPADTIVMNGQLYELEDANEVSVEFERTYNGSWNATQIAVIHVISSTSGVQIAAGRDITADHYAWPEGSVVVISFTRGSATIRLKGTAGDTVVLTY